MTTTQLPITTITFPEISLRVRDAHKLRGYFGNLFREHSPLLHNHYDNGQFRQGYPLVQYKVLSGVPTLVGLGEGAQLLVELFLRIKALEIDGHKIEVMSKHIDHAQAPIEVGGTLMKYRFETLWMPLNEINHKEYMLSEDTRRKEILQRILLNNLLAFMKGTGTYQADIPQLMLLLNVEVQTSTKFKDNDMLAFKGDFVVNAHLPNGIGLGKSVSRGFGTIKKI